MHVNAGILGCNVIWTCSGYLEVCSTKMFISVSEYCVTGQKNNNDIFNAIRTSNLVSYTDQHHGAIEISKCWVKDSEMCTDVCKRLSRR